MAHGQPLENNKAFASDGRRRGQFEGAISNVLILAAPHE